MHKLFHYRLHRVIQSKRLKKKKKKGKKKTKAYATG
jgi:hypothetical protein